ncbi:MAG TPA: trypsin-like peptidase domain-containing protein [Roseiflexaceae bacterium]|mgnify:CR=1 FL=1|nr:trypsin-like peptidase domain-containing protein [Roseiflexaceae bacterium]HMP42063.1 trypsin-like peptidase domain-containing protein [Roseiflexaceae bacterium]
MQSIATTLAPLVEKVRPSVVQVRSGRRGQGTGVIWRRDGAILTNDHVVAGAQGKLRILLDDGRHFDAEVAARNPQHDLALLRISADDLPAATIGDSTQLRIGELVFALGHPWGQPWVVTAGIVSGLGEAHGRDGAPPVPIIRSDVRLRPGNSGGPLLDAAGAVVGINAMVFGGDLSVAIPAHLANSWLGEIPAPRSILGVSVHQAPLPADLQRGAWAGRGSGLLIIAVQAGGTAERSGLLVGDLLLDIAGHSIETTAELQATLDQRAGQATRLYVARGEAVVAIDLQE